MNFNADLVRRAISNTNPYTGLSRDDQKLVDDLIQELVSDCYTESSKGNYKVTVSFRPDMYQLEYNRRNFIIANKELFLAELRKVIGDDIKVTIEHTVRPPFTQGSEPNTISIELDWAIPSTGVSANYRDVQIVPISWTNKQTVYKGNIWQRLRYLFTGEW